LLGVVFFVPFVWFAWVAQSRAANGPGMLLLFALGGLQGFVGWWIGGKRARDACRPSRNTGSRSISVSRSSSSARSYGRRWNISVPSPPLRGRGQGEGASPRVFAYILVALVYIQMLLGALVAGLHAGLIYNTWPSMDGRLFPENRSASRRGGAAFEDPGLAQFDHASVPTSCFFCSARAFHPCTEQEAQYAVRKTRPALWRTGGVPGRARDVTLLTQAPLALAAAHQVTAAAFSGRHMARVRTSLRRHRLIEIGDDVLDILDADGEPHHIVAGTRSRALLGFELAHGWSRRDG